MLARGNAYGRLFAAGMRELGNARGLVPLPLMERMHLQHLAQANRADFERAETLGWREPTPEDDQRYLRKVQERIQANQ